MPDALAPSAQYLRKVQLLIRTVGTEALDLSALHIKFATKRSNTATPNSADIRVYNVAPTTIELIKQESQVILQAGYEGNYGVIFVGNIKQVITGRESSTDTFIDLVAGDGDTAYNFAIVNKTLAAGSKPEDQVNASIQSMSEKGVTQGYIKLDTTTTLPRAKVMYGNSKDYLTHVSQNTKQDWSIQEGKVNFVALKSYLPGERVVLNSKTGMIGTPQQTNEGVNIKCLLNPLIKVGGLVEINNKDVARLKINLTTPNSAANIPAPLSYDGVYFVYVVETIGDNRGQDFYCNLICFYQDPSAGPLAGVGGSVL